MAGIVNARDTALQAAAERLKSVTLQSNLQVEPGSVVGLGPLLDSLKGVSLSSSSQVLQIAKSGATSPASVTLTAGLQGLTGTPTLSIVTGTMSVTPTLTGGVFTFTPTQVTSDVVTFRLSLTEGGTTYTDDMTVVKVREGIDSLSGFLTNESIALPANTAGVVVSYAGSSGNFEVYQGINDVSSLCTFALAPGGNPSGLTYTLNANGSTAGAFSVTGGFPTGTDLTTLTFRATFGAATVDKVLTLAKAKSGTSAVAGVLTNEAHAVPTDVLGNGGDYSGASTTLAIMNGDVDDSAFWTVTAAPSTGVTGSLAGKTYTVSAMTVDAGYVDLTAARSGYVSIVKRFSLSKAKSGNNGKAFWMTTSAPAVQKSIAGALTPSTVTYSILSSTGGAAPAAYAGRFVIDSSADGLTYVNQFTSVADESSKAYAIPSGAKTVRVRAYLAGGTTSLLDEVITTVVADGATGASGVNAINAIVSNETHVFSTDSAGVVQTYAGSGTEIRVYEGATELVYDGVGTSNGTWKVTVTASGITAGTLTDSGNYLTVGTHSGMAAGSDVATVTYAIIGKTSTGGAFGYNKTQTFSKSKAGATGATGQYGLNFSEAKSLFTDPTFQSGSNAIGVYNNAGGGTVTHAREAKQSDSPFTDSGFNIKISNTGAASPGIGGYIHNFTGRANAVFVQRIVAKIPVGYTIEQASNSIGDGAVQEWITSNAGSGKFQEYILVRRCGATGTFSGSGHIYLQGPVGTPAAPVVWYLAYAATYDFTALGFSTITAVLSNEAHVVPTDSAGNNGVFTGCASTMTIYNGSTDDSANWSVVATPSNVTGSLVGKTYTVTAMSADVGYVDFVASRGGFSNVTSRFTVSKSKAGAAGAQGPSVLVTPNRATTFTATDGTLDAAQADIVFTAAVSGVASPTYVWSFSGFQIAPTNSGTATQTITAAQFGTAKSAIVTCTVSGAYTDKVTIARLEKSTAAAGATVGATWGANISGQPANNIIYNSSVTLAADGTLNGAGGGQVTLPGMGMSSYRVVAAGYTATNKPIAAGLYDAKTGGLLVGMASMYRVVKIHRTTGVLTNVGGWNVLAGGTNSADMAAALNAIGNDHIVIVFTNDEPAGNRLTGGLPAAMYRCGASRGVFGSSSFQGRSAYALIGIAGCGEGNGAEFYQGETYGDANAWIDASFSIIGGNLVGVSGSYTPRTLQDYGYAGALDANNTYVDDNGTIQGVSSGGGTVVNNAFLETLTFSTTNTTVNGNSFKKTGGTANTWDAQAYSKESYTLGAFASFSPDQTTGHSMAGLNIDPASDANYTTIDYAVYLNNGTVAVYESNVSRGNFGTYVAGDIFGVTYDGVNVRYYKNGSLLRTVAATITAPLYFDSSIYTLNNSISKVKFGPMTSNAWGSIGGAGKPADNATVGAPAGTSVGGVLAETVASKANGALQKAGDQITGRVTMSVADGIFAGTDTNNGVYVGNGGIVGKKAGATTFAVDTAGNASFAGTLNVASAASGARMEIKNNVIKVFDSAGVLRVQIGDLTV